MASIVQQVSGNAGALGLTLTLGSPVTAGNILAFSISRRNGGTSLPTVANVGSSIGAARSYTFFGSPTIVDIRPGDVSGSDALGIAYRTAVGDEQTLYWSDQKVKITYYELTPDIDPAAVQFLSASEHAASGTKSVGTFTASNFQLGAFIWDNGDSTTTDETVGTGWTQDRQDADGGFHPGFLAMHGASATAAQISGGSWEWAGVAVAFTAALPTGDGAILLDVYSPGTAGSPALTYLDTIFDATDKQVRIERNGIGSGQFTLNRYSVYATSSLIAQGNLVKVRVPQIDTGHVAAFWMETGDFTLVSPNEESGENLVISGRGAMAYLDWARAWPDNFVVPATHTGTSWIIGDVTASTGNAPGQILRRTIAEAQHASRPEHPIPLLTVDFDYTNDSLGNAWSTFNIHASGETGESLLTSVQRLTSSNTIDVEMDPDLGLHGYNSLGVDRHGTAFGTSVVRFVKGTNIIDEVHRSWRQQPIVTNEIILGVSPAWSTAVVSDASSFPTREYTINATNGSATQLAALGTADLAYRRAQQDSVTFRIVNGTVPSSGLYLPGGTATANGKFWIGDTVTLHTGTSDLDYNNQSLRVAAISLYEDAAGNLETAVELGARMFDLTSGSSNGGGGSSYASGATSTSGVQSTSTNSELNIEGGQDLINALGNMGTAITIDPTLGNVVTGTLNAGTCVVTLSAPNGSGAATMELWITQDGTGGRVITWPGAVTWDGGVAPSPSTTAGVTVRYVLESVNGGTTWIGDLVGSSTVTYATPNLTLGTANAAGTAASVIRSDATILAFDATVPTTITAGDAASAGTAAVSAHRDHKHGADSSITARFLVIASSHSTPLVFADLVQNADSSDLIYTS